MEKADRKKIVLFVFILIIYFLADIFNISTSIGIPVAKINWNIASIFVSNSIVLMLYLITYHLIDKKNITKENNQRNIAKLVAKETYRSCLDFIRQLENPYIRTSAAKKCDFNEMMFRDDVMQYCLNYPFEYHNEVVDFAKSGVITAEEYRSYLQIRGMYKQNVTNIIAFLTAKRNWNVKKRKQRN